MRIELVNYTPLKVCSDAIRTCWQSHDKSDNGGEKDKALIDRVGNKNRHSSTLEHLVYNFHIYDISRAVLQEFSRHRIASLSVKSTRYTLKELKNEAPFYCFIPNAVNFAGNEWERAKKYIKLTDNKLVDIASIMALENIRCLLLEGISNDKIKYALPECYLTEIAWTVNARSLQNFLSLRSSPHALWEIRDLANNIFESLPEDHKYLFEDSLYKENENL